MYIKKKHFSHHHSLNSTYSHTVFSWQEFNGRGIDDIYNPFSVRGTKPLVPLPHPVYSVSSSSQLVVEKTGQQETFSAGSLLFPAPAYSFKPFFR